MFPWTRRLSFAVLFFSVTATTASARGDVDQPLSIVLRVGEQKSLSAKGVRSYSEGAPGIADIRVTRDQSRFVIVGRSVGTGSLLLIRHDGSQVQYTIRVIPADASKGSAGRENIRLDLYFVLIQDRYSHQIGLNWPGNIGSTLTPSEAALAITGGSGIPTQTAFQILPETFLPSLDLAQSKGWAKLYRQAALVTANGTEAVFSAGGEFNVQVQNNLTVDVQAIEFGTKVTVLPKYDPRTGRIELEITADVSDLDQERGFQGIPGRITTHVETLVNLELGQSVSLAGIHTRSERRSKDGLPGLAMIPFIGALFGTHGRETEDTKSYMLVVPSVVEPVSLTQRNRIEEAIRVYDSFRGGVESHDLMDEPRVGKQSGRNTQGSVK
ncbi:MAG: pilus assembly protein N-terminal domain-containing protein [Deltaproteobacteria bacterium]|nr:pilus assembly protein N-terminal domain-containing protein [Deltaproteobacteria bacterium]